MRVKSPEVLAAEHTQMLETLAIINAFFRERPELISIILDARINHNEVWDSFFAYYNGSPPHDETEIRDYPLQRHPGSTDKRWETLLHNRRGMKAMQVFVENFKSLVVTFPQTQEAA